MTTATFAPPSVPPEQVPQQLRQRGYAVMTAEDVARWAACDLADLQALIPTWEGLPPDNYLKDGGRYRRRRHSCFVVTGAEVQQVPHRAHWQPLEYNALHGGMERWFEPLAEPTVGSPAWAPLLTAVAQAAATLRRPPGEPAQPWFIEAHQFRIDTTDGIGRPTPEGAHRDGVDLVAVFMIAREGIKGGETRVFEAEGPNGQRFTLTQPWSLLLLDDESVIHESTPIQPVHPGGYRDTLVLTCRAGGFQGLPG
ncbi:2OG-Fe dioxygenase family protein [Curvibacter sp. HBC61]|uniref:2OG-Fe dioxygenase family protein n=1 Tax=Curvibacter cyanobacteriorum TaxID=3026422 RepID=A0ABT5MTF3_9BURK|nr:2OG-Fe dioxygenase family protein [Curvibacter sp. HBC61]MDD0837312.1 2OG-Fe dioxygenase family protein [Curvibacter sp. HBC61]